MFQKRSQNVTLSENNWIISVNCKSEISNVSNLVEGHCLQAMKIVHHHANGGFDSLLSEYQSINPYREAISTLSGTDTKDIHSSITWATT